MAMTQLEYNRRYRAKHPERVRHARRLRTLREYGLSKKEYDQMFLDQGEACKACGTTEPRGENQHARGFWDIDHNHATDEVRGILCHNCNAAIGMVGESIDTLLDIANYLGGDSIARASS